MWNPFKKNQQQTNTAQVSDDVKNNDSNKDDEKVDSSKMNMLQRLAMKKMEKMSPQEKAKMTQEVFKPENRDKLLSVMEMMRKSGQITEEQYRMAKQKMGM
ncbi:MAG: hypothetical protein WA019_06050 [Candidatus Moraniibacteriota bacterium]